MNIIYLRTVYWFNLKSGGSVGHTSGVINALKKKHNVRIISNDKLFNVKHPVEIIQPVKLLLIPDQLNEIFYNFKITRKLKDISNIDFIYHRYSGFSNCGAKLSKKHSVPLVLEFNSSEVWKLKNWQAKRNPFLDFIIKAFKLLVLLPIAKRNENLNLRQASLIVVVSNVLKENLIEQGINSEKILVNPNGIDIDEFNPGLEKDDRLEKKMGLKGYFVFGFIGTFGYWHGIIEFAEAIIDFFTNHPDLTRKIKFLLIGNGVLFNEVKKIIDRSAFSKNVVFTGEVEQYKAPGYLTLCDVLVSPHKPNKDGTKFFGSPTKLFEYMALGKPIIASDLDQIGEILEHEKTACLVEPGNIKELSNALYKLFHNFEKYKKMGQQSFYEVSTKYTWEHHVTKILDKLDELR
ncbi:MAG: glycosyltransferase family 4 protein [bacterium]